MLTFVLLLREQLLFFANLIVYFSPFLHYAKCCFTVLGGDNHEWKYDSFIDSDFITCLICMPYKVENNFPALSLGLISHLTATIYWKYSPADWVLFSDIVGWQGNVTDYLDVQKSEKTCHQINIFIF